MKKKLKKQINQTVRSVFIYYLILVGVSFLYILWKSTVVSGQTGAGVFSGQMMKYAADKAGILSLAGTAAGLFYMAVRYRKTKDIRHMLRSKNPMTIRAFLAVFCTCVGLLMQNLALAHVPSSIGSLLLSLESPSGVFFSVVLAGEMLSGRLIAGFALIFISIVFSETHGAFLLRIAERLEGATHKK